MAYFQVQIVRQLVFLTYFYLMEYRSLYWHKMLGSVIFCAKKTWIKKNSFAHNTISDPQGKNNSAYSIYLPLGAKFDVN